MTATNLEPVTVMLDAGFDLYQGHSGDVKAFAAARGISDKRGAWDAFCNDYAAAYRGAARDLGEELGVTITVGKPPMSNYGGCEAESEQWAKNANLWQVLHDMVQWDADAAEWVPTDDTAKYAARVLAKV